MLTPRGVVRFDLLIGAEVFAFIPIIDPSGPLFVRINSVDEGGIWIENERLTVGWCRKRQQGDELDTEVRAVVFIPYSQIIYVARFDILPAERKRVVPFVQRETPAPETTPA